MTTLLEDSLARALQDCMQQIDDQQSMPDDSHHRKYDGLLVHYAEAQKSKPQGVADAIVELALHELITQTGTIKASSGDEYIPIPDIPAMRAALEAVSPMMAQVPDVERMDYLERCVMQDGGTLSADRDRDPYIDSPTFGDLPTVTLFTVPSQHVKGVGLRGAIDAAMIAAASDANGGAK